MKNETKLDLTLYLFPSVALVVVFLVIFLAIWPNVSSYQSQEDQRTILESEVADLHLKYDTIHSLDGNELTKISDKANVAVPTEKTFPGLLSGLEALAKQAGSDLNSFEAAPRVISKVSISGSSIAEAKPLSQEEIDLGLNHLTATTGIFSNASSLIDLTSLLIKSSRLVTLEKVTFERPEKLASSDKSNVKIELQVYYQPDVKATQAAYFKPISEDERTLISKVDAFNTFNLQLPDFIPSKDDPFAK